jgi:methylglutaconyl-CoA hydratase
MTDQTILCVRGARGVATVTLNRPERGNAMNPALIDDLGAAMQELGADESVRIIVLRGAGKHFCAGADVGGRGEGEPRFTLATMLETIEKTPKPTIAVVQGAAAGGGMALAACCDILLGTPEAFFTIPEARLGMAPSVTLAGLFVRAIGLRAFRRYGFSGERIVAQEALRLGLLSEVAPATEMEARLEALIDALLHSAPGAIATLKARVADFDVPPISMLFDPAVRDARHARSPEADEGIAAFKEKRKPSWYL